MYIRGSEGWKEGGRGRGVERKRERKRERRGVEVTKNFDEFGCIKYKGFVLPCYSFYAIFCMNLCEFLYILFSYYTIVV